MKNRTKICKKRMILFNMLSILIWIGIAIFSFVTILVKTSGSGSKDINNYIEIKSGLIGIGITILIALIISIFISNKLRTTLYMLSVIVAALIYGNVAMIIEFAIWSIDEYVFKSLAAYYKNAYITNKEIDLREAE